MQRLWEFKVLDFESKLDNCVKLNQEYWCVTLICAKGSNHAEIIVEGVNDEDQYFMKIAHLIGQFSKYENGQTIDESFCGFNHWGKLEKFKEIKCDKLEYAKKSDTWKRSKSLVEKLISSVNSESESQTPIAFNILGRYSVFARSQYVPISKVKYQKMGFFEKAYFKIKDFSDNTDFPMLPLPHFYLLQQPLKLLPPPPNSILARPHNCFTWSAEKLKLAEIDLDLESNYFSSVASITRMYTK